MENHSNTSNTSSAKSSESKAAYSKIQLHSEIRRAIEANSLVSISRVEIPSQAQKTLFLILTASGAVNPYIQVYFYKINL